LAFFPFFWSPFFFETLPPAPSADGFSTMNRYLHLGHSTFFHMNASLLMSTLLSQLGQGMLKLAIGFPLRVPAEEQWGEWVRTKP